MASLDVESLFTNISLEQTVKNCVNDLFSNNFYSGKLSRKNLYELLKLATTELFFIFDNKLYKQIDRVAMGSPSHWLMPFSVIMKKFGLMNALLSLNLWFTDVTLTIFVLFKSKEHLKLFVNYMNSKHSNIKFTFETEDPNNFSFLDVKITQKNKRFVTSIFGKDSLSGVFTNYDSFIFDTYKIGFSL